MVRKSLRLHPLGPRHLREIVNFYLGTLALASRQITDSQLEARLQSFVALSLAVKSSDGQ